ncbi:MAG: SNF2 family N-terminal domain-containing protein [Podila humilis]|nr:MAG: SNF2 family N-terminal domain-containing protein [Podila humilis]
MRKSAAPSQRASSSGASSRPRMVPIVPTKTPEGSSATSELVAKESSTISSGATIKESSIPLPSKSPLASRPSSYKPGQFRSPLLSTAGSSSSPITPVPASSPISSNKREAEPSSLVNKRSKVSPATLHKSATTTATSRTPLKSFASTTPTCNDSNEMCYNVLWRKKTGKKHKTWDGDGILVVTGTSGSLKDVDGKDLGKATKMAASSLKPGDELSFGGKDIEISSVMDLELYRSGRCFLSGAVTTVSDHKIPITTKFKAHAGLVDPGAASSRPQPRHSPDAPHAILLPRPPATHPRVVRGGGSKRPPGDAGLVDVVVDPILGQHLRPHQRVGVQFLYECVMQMKDITGQGAILADEMGLGKTLQTITLLWTLLKQSPYYGEESSVVKRALVVCPASLIMNWCKEFKKWLGDERLKVFAVDSKSALTDFTLGRVYPVMVIGYEKLRMVQDELKNANFDIIICDEGHRLKTANIKTAQAIRSLSTKKRIILSGTPLQNHLSEYYSMIDFVNPGLFESYSSFKKVFEDPIVKSRQPDCIPTDAALGLERSQELTSLTGQFILRRTAQVNLEYLPPKTEIVVFCPPSPLQSRVYRQMTDSPYLKSCFSMDGSRHLTCITALRKLCNSPQLVLDQAELKDDPEIEGLYSGVKETIMQSGYDLMDLTIGGKLGFVDSFLRVLKRNTSEKVVLVSNFTQTLDILEAICVKSQYAFYRLDGSTPIAKRQEYVDKFNAPTCQKFVFLLSAKSGGAGLNLIGASRLIMFDIDWNPSVDQQAMARIHRDGQPRPVFIYRLLSSGTIEEKMYQRQLTKIGLSDALMDGKSDEKLNKFSMAELRDLFTFHEDEPCLTHTLLECDCSSSRPTKARSTRLGGGNGILNAQSKSVAKKELQEWKHVDVVAEQQRHGGDEEGATTLPSEDKILWRAICGEGRSEGEDAPGSPGQDEQGVTEVGFVFIKSSKVE